MFCARDLDEKVSLCCSILVNGLMKKRRYIFYVFASRDAITVVDVNIRKLKLVFFFNFIHSINLLFASFRLLDCIDSRTYII